MQNVIMVCLRFLFFSMLLAAQVTASDQKPIAVIFDTDMGPDYDDVGAMSLLHAFADRNEIKILATIASNRYEGVAGVLNVINTYFGRPDIPIGIPKQGGVSIRDPQHWSDSLLLNFPHKITMNGEVPDATKLYRQILSRQADHSVTIITVGFLTNLQQLLLSAPDEYSELGGKALIEKKVKMLVSMAGSFPAGNEYNIRTDLGASKEVVSNWPTPILFTGVEIGRKIKTGLPLINSNIKNNPIKDAYRISIPQDPQDSAGRMSWDQTAVLIAVRGTKPWYRKIKGRMTINDNGTNGWNKIGKNHAYIIERKNYLVVQSLINELMMHQPVRH